MSAAQPFIGEIFMFAGNFAPQGWAFCNGQIMSIAQNTALFALLGTTYGGDGQQTFALPDLRGRVPVHFGSSPGGSSYVQGEMAGVENVTIQTSQLPPHRHAANGNGGGNVVSPANAVWSTDPFGNTAAYTDPGNSTMSPAAIGSPTPAAQPHDNMQPFLGINFIISLYGIFPSRN